MSSNVGVDLYGYYNQEVQRTTYNAKTVYADSAEANNTLSFQDMLLLMVTQLQNQTIEDSVSTSDMMNQIIQMTVMQAITEMSTKMEDVAEANILSYSASLVGKTVTMAVLDDKGQVVDEKVGEVTATGTYNGQRVIYVDGERFPINQILAVGTLPAKPSEGTDTDDTGNAGGAGDVDSSGSAADKDESGEITDVPTTPPTNESEGGTDAAEDEAEIALG